MTSTEHPATATSTDYTGYCIVFCENDCGADVKILRSVGYGYCVDCEDDVRDADF